MEMRDLFQPCKKEKEKKKESESGGVGMRENMLLTNKKLMWWVNKIELKSENCGCGSEREGRLQKVNEKVKKIKLKLLK